MIPKIIHYCWFGRNPIPDEYKEYIRTWKKMCPDYEIKMWNEDNFDVNQNEFCREAYEKKKWAFVSDYARLKIIYTNGGIYLDTDIEVIKDITPLIEEGVGYIGFQNSEQINTGLGFAAEPHDDCVKSMLEIYEKKKFDNQLENIICPVLNTVALKRLGLKVGGKYSNQVQCIRKMKVYPEQYFNPVNINSRKIKCTDNTYTIHHYAASWSNKKSITLRKFKKFLPQWLLDKRTIWMSKKQVIQYEKKYEEKYGR